MPLCSAFQCKNNGTHRFPSDEKKRNLWIKALRIKNWKPNSSSRICSDHFKPNDFYVESWFTGLKHQRKNLKKDAVPSLFSFSKLKASKPKRQQRYEARSPHTGASNQTLINNDIYVAPHSSQERKIEDTVPILDMGCEVVVPNTGKLTEEKNKEMIGTANKLKTDQSTQINIEYVYGSIDRFKDDDNAISFYTGFESYENFYLVYSTLSPMTTKLKFYCHQVLNVSYENQFLLTMMKLWQNKTIFELGKFFCISCSTVSNIFITWIHFIYQTWNKLDIWPSRDLIKFYMPESFKRYDNTVRVTLDGTEFPVQKPGNNVAQQASWSTHKHSNILEEEVGATPGGLLSYCSPAYGGSTSDRQTIERSDLLIKCEPGDTILADRGCNGQDIFVSKNIKVNIPAFFKSTVLHDRELASKRVHIEKLIGLTKTYKILKHDLDHSYVPLASKIFYICLMCCNFREGIVNKHIK